MSIAKFHLFVTDIFKRKTCSVFGCQLYNTSQAFYVGDPVESTCDHPKTFTPGGWERIPNCTDCIQFLTTFPETLVFHNTRFQVETRIPVHSPLQTASTLGQTTNRNPLYLPATGDHCLESKRAKVKRAYPKTWTNNELLKKTTVPLQQILLGMLLCMVFKKCLKQKWAKLWLCLQKVTHADKFNRGKKTKCELLANHIPEAMIIVHRNTFRV